MCALRKSGLTHVDVSSAFAAKRTSNCGGANNRRLRPMLITTRRDQRDRAHVVTAIRVTVNAAVQSRRKADEKCPGKSCKQNARNKDTGASL